MTKFFKPILLLFAITISLNSCKDKKEDEVPVPVPNTLEGNWKIDSLRIAQYDGGTLDPADVFTLPNVGSVLLRPDKTGRITVTLPFVGTQSDSILNWSNTATTLQLISRESGASSNDTVLIDLVVNTTTNQEWFFADPSKTDPDRTETRFKLSK